MAQTLIYVLPSDSKILSKRKFSEISNKEFKENSYESYTLSEFEVAFNEEFISDQDFIRIITE